MGIKDWFKKKPTSEPKDATQPSQPSELPELDKEKLVEEALSVILGEETDPEVEIIIDAVPEYDTGEVDLDSLMDESLHSNYDLNTVENKDYEDVLEDARIIGDLPEEVIFE